MKQLPSYWDQRQVARCVFCGAGTETKDHVPSKVLLDRPFPDNLPNVPACEACNGGFSLTEEYVACLLACILAGTPEPAAISRSNIKRILEEKPALLARLRAAWDPVDRTFEIESERVRQVVLKLARGHAAYELNEPMFDEPRHVWVRPLATLSSLEYQAFESAPGATLWPEVGSRAMQRAVVTDGVWLGDWVVVQEGRYRYLASGTEDGILVRSVLSEYLGCEAFWSTGI